MKLILIKLKEIIQPDYYDKLKEWITKKELEEEAGDKKAVINCIYDEELLNWLKTEYNKILTKRKKPVKEVNKK